MALVCDEQAWENHLASKGNRFAALAVHKSIRIKPKFIRDLLARPYEKRGLEVIGIGYCSTVLRMGESAVKLHRATERMSHEEQLERVKDLTDSQEILLRYMGDYAIPQSFEVIEHPLRPKGIVASIQPIVEGFNPLRVDNVGCVSRLDASQKKVVREFTGCTFDMVADTGWVPDLNGADNFGFTKDGDSFVMVDTTPIKLRKPPDPYVETASRLATAVQ